MIICLSFHISQAVEDESRECVERGIEYIKTQDKIRAHLFRISNNDAHILNHTYNIYALLQKPEKVSLIHHAEPHEKEVIFKAIMTSAILHMPISGDDYHSYLDFYESDLDLPESVILRKHFEIIRYSNRFVKAVVKGSVTRNFSEGQFYNCQMLLQELKISSDDFFRWFSEVCNEFNRKDIQQYLKLIKIDYEKYLTANYHRGKEFAIFGVRHGDKFDAHIAGMHLKFSVHKVLGDGTCGYYALGITRDDFIRFLKNNLNDLEIKEKILIALRDGYEHYRLGLIKLNLDSENDLYEKIIDTYYSQARHYLKTEEIELVSGFGIISKGSDPGSYSEGKLDTIWNQKPLNQQIICVWTYASPEKLTFSGAYFQGKLIGKNADDSMILDPIGENPRDFTQAFQRMIREGDIIHIYNNGYNHYDRLIVINN